MSNLIVFMTPRIIQTSEDIDNTIKESMRGYRARLEKDWADMFPKSFPSKRIKERQKGAMDDAESGDAVDGCGEAADGCGCGEPEKDDA